MFGICNLAIIPRLEPSDRSEIVSQILFGEHFEILEQQNNGLKSKCNMMIMKVGSIPSNCKTISESSFNQLSSEAIILNADLIEYVTEDNLLIPIPLGSSVSFLHHNDINS
jgi:hypothetical protein